MRKEKLQLITLFSNRGGRMSQAIEIKCIPRASSFELSSWIMRIFLIIHLEVCVFHKQIDVSRKNNFDGYSQNEKSIAF